MANRPTSTPSSIEPLLATTMQTVLTEWCITDVPEDDASRANAVIIGKPTDELRQDIVVSIHTQHPFGPIRDRDTRVDGVEGGGLSRSPHRFPQETLGGMRTEEIIGCVQVNIRLRKESEDATWLIGPVIERVKQGIDRDKRLIGLEDDLGNYLSIIETFRADGYAGGGGKVTTNFRWVDFRAYVHRTNCPRV